MEIEDGAGLPYLPCRMSFSTASRVSFVFIIFLVASVVVCVFFCVILLYLVFLY